VPSETRVRLFDPVDLEISKDNAYRPLAAVLVGAFQSLYAGEKPATVEKKVLRGLEQLKPSYGPLEGNVRGLFSRDNPLEAVKRVLISINDAVVVVPELGPRIKSALSDKSSYAKPRKTNEPLQIEPSLPVTNGYHDEGLSKSVSDAKAKKYLSVFRKQHAAFQRRLPELRKEYCGEFVALSQLEVAPHNPVLAHGSDLQKLMEKVRTLEEAGKVKPDELYIDQVLPAPSESMPMDLVQT